MCFAEVSPFALEVDTATGNLYFTRNTKLMRLAKNDNTQTVFLNATDNIYSIAIDQLNR